MKRVVIGITVLSFFFCLITSVQAQDDSVTISAEEFQRMVYSGHLLMQLDEKPELDASLHVLLELQRHNPTADPIALADVLWETTELYRTNAPAYLEVLGNRDEILSMYIENFLQVPARTNYASISLNLLDYFTLKPDDYATGSAAELIHSGNQRLLSAEEAFAQREDLVELCTLRAYENSDFGRAMDSLLWEETGVLLSDEPFEILTVNTALSNSPTMQLMLDRSYGSPDGSVTISTNELKNLFVQEMDVMHGIINTNLALHLEILATKTNLTSYLSNTNLIAENIQREAAVKQGQTERITAAYAAIIVTGDFTAQQSPLLSKHMVTVGRAVKSIGDGIKAVDEAKGVLNVAATGNFVGAALALTGVFLDIAGPSPEQMIMDELADIKGMINDLSVNMNYRFDRIDKTLNQLGENLGEVLDRLSYSIDLIYDLGDGVDIVRHDLVDVQTDLHRLERHLILYLDQLYTRELNVAFNTWLNYEEKHLSQRMDAVNYRDDAEPIYYTQTVNNSLDQISAPYLDRDYSPTGLYWELTESGSGTSNRLDQNLRYIKKYLADELGQPTVTDIGDLANPRDWFVGAYAYMQLAAENPDYYRHEVDPVYGLDHIIPIGNNLVDFLASLTFTGTNINWVLLDAVLDNYATRQSSFVGQAHVTEQDHADLFLDDGFPVSAWRNWAATAPRVTTTGTAITPLPLYAQGVTSIAAAGYHTLALKDDGTIAGWGANDRDQITIPEEETNVIAIAGGLEHSLALHNDGRVSCWGSDDYSQCSVPGDATNIITVSAGYYHNLAIKEDGRVIAWGAGDDNVHSFPDYKQSMVPASATNITAVAAGGYHSLALRADGTLLPWGLNNEEQLEVPPGATNVIAIAAGHGHNLVLKNDGTLVAWGNNLYGSTDVPPDATNIVAIAAAGWHNLALRDDGKFFSWGLNNYGQSLVPSDLTDVHTLAAGRFHSLAQKSDGTVVGWGLNSSGQCSPPGSPPGGVVAVEAGLGHCLALKEDGTVVGWGLGTNDAGVYRVRGQAMIPTNLTDVVAIAAGDEHSLALKEDGQVVAWGAGTSETLYANPHYKQSVVPASATNVMAISAAGWHSLALRTDGSVIGWGYNDHGEAMGIPGSPSGFVTVAGYPLSNVVAIAAGRWYNLALQNDGTIVGWGWNTYGQSSIPPAAINVVAIAGGYGHSLALRSDGEVVVWGWNDYGQLNKPVSATNIVAITGGFGHSSAIRADGTVVSWGFNDSGQTNTPANAGHLIEISAGSEFNLALQANGTVLCWGANNYGQTNVPSSLRPESCSKFEIPIGLSVIANLTGIAASKDWSLGCKADGTVMAWGVNDHGQCSVPAGLGGVTGIAAGHHHGVALMTNGGIVAWGGNAYGQTNVPSTILTGVEAIAAGGNHSLALKNDGLVYAWGLNSVCQTDVPDDLDNVVAIAAGTQHSLALKANGTVRAWGAIIAGDVPAGLDNVVAIAAGEWHNLALRSDGSVVAWGGNGYGQTDVPMEAQSGVVAIKASHHHSLALKADGSVVAWGANQYGQTNLPPDLSNVVAMAAGWRHNVFLTAQDSFTSSSGSSGSSGSSESELEFLPANVPSLITEKWLYEVNVNLLAELDQVGDLHDRATELSGSRALLQSVLELGMPYTLERDDVLHGFLYGTEALADLDTAKELFSAETNRLATIPYARPMVFEEVVGSRYDAFVNRLSERLQDLEATGQPEIPRIVGHTLRLLNLLRDAWDTVPPPEVEVLDPADLTLISYGEPYMRYSLLYSDSLTNGTWYATGVSNIVDQETFTMPVTNVPQRYYRLSWP